jgi:hypothetical protein
LPDRHDIRGGKHGQDKHDYWQGDGATQHFVSPVDAATTVAARIAETSYGHRDKRTARCLFPMAGRWRLQQCAAAITSGLRRINVRFGTLLKVVSSPQSPQLACTFEQPKR